MKYSYLHNLCCLNHLSYLKRKKQLWNYEDKLCYDAQCPFWPSDTTWHHWTWSILIQVMACCLMAPSNYLNQCRITISMVMCHPFTGNNTQNAYESNHYIAFQNYILKKITFPRGQGGGHNITVYTAYQQQRSYSELTKVNFNDSMNK